jgi:hypothetical protein
VRLRRSALGLAALVCAACGPPPPEPARARVYPGELRAPSAFEGDFLLRWRVAASYRDKRVTFDAVLQKRGDELTLLGLTPYGSRAFVLKQTRDEVHFERHVPEELPFPPRYILLDVHRVMLAGVAGGGVVLPDGEHEAARGGETVRERWRNGRLVERVFRRISPEPAGVVAIAYEGGMVPGREAPRRIAFRNEWFGYRLDISIQSFERL